MMMIMIRISVSENEKNQEKNNEIRTSLAYLTSYLTYLTIVTSPVLCLVCIVHTYRESLNKVDKGVEIVYSRISSGNYFTCVYQSAVNICNGPDEVKSLLLPAGTESFPSYNVSDILRIGGEFD